MPFSTSSTVPPQGQPLCADQLAFTITTLLLPTSPILQESQSPPITFEPFIEPEPHHNHTALTNSSQPPPIHIMVTRAKNQSRNLTFPLILTKLVMLNQPPRLKHSKIQMASSHV
ncbi:hypothetical protein Pint_18430 [Pistacia integerrima]|uniref:Uncharacterized protein n=1 Tax=Pistacia integerrima TaxID=434235 RepID=A0ACC0YZW2_9ROSI|nr:hypothetical protein Pint_18430 [Pistacia integerrima]